MDDVDGDEWATGGWLCRLDFDNLMTVDENGNHDLRYHDDESNR